MKKIIAILLVAVMCLSLVACGGGNNASPEKDIVGEWKSLDGAVTTFNEDGTGTAPYGGAFSWKYDAETECYTILLEEFTFSCEFKNEDGIRFVSIAHEKYYHTDDYAKAAEANK